MWLCTQHPWVKGEAQGVRTDFYLGWWLQSLCWGSALPMVLHSAGCPHQLHGEGVSSPLKVVPGLRSWLTPAPVPC